MQLVGPGDIVGINRRAVVRTEPRNGVTDFEPNYLAFIEFYDEDFPWRYTPARAVPRQRTLAKTFNQHTEPRPDFFDGARRRRVLSRQGRHPRVPCPSSSLRRLLIRRIFSRPPTRLGPGPMCTSAKTSPGITLKRWKIWRTLTGSPLPAHLPAQAQAADRLPCLSDPGL